MFELKLLKFRPSKLNRTVYFPFFLEKKNRTEYMKKNTYIVFFEGKFL